MIKKKKIKFKTRKSVSKRFRINANGLLKYRSPGMKHKLIKKSSKKKRLLRGIKILSKSNSNRMIKMLR